MAATRPAALFLAGTAGEMAQYLPTVRHPITLIRFIVLESGRPGIEMEVESKGRSRILITEVSGQVVLLNCFGELGPFDEVVVTLRAAD
jgi:hypothetical protein